MIFDFAVKGKAELISALLDEGVHPQPKPEIDDETLVPLHAAAFNDNLACVEILVEKGHVPVDVKDDLGGTPLMRAAGGGNLEVVKWLLEKGADPLTVQGRGIGEDLPRGGATALDFACGNQKGDLEVVKLFLEHPVFGPVEKKMATGDEKEKLYVTRNGLDAAAISGTAEILNYLLEKAGFPVEDTNAEGKWKGDVLSGDQKAIIHDLLLNSSTKPQLGTFKVLLTYFAKTDQDGKLEDFDITPELQNHFTNALFNPTAKNNVESFEVLWNTLFHPSNPTRSAGIHAADPGLFNDLLAKTQPTPQNPQGAWEMSKLLITKYGANPDHVAAPTATTLLYVLAANNHVERVKWLLENCNMDLGIGNGKFANGATALYIPVWNGYPDIVRLLLKYGGPVEELPDLKDLVGEGEFKLTVVTEKKYRAPVRVFLGVKEEMGKTEDSRKVVLDCGDDDREWLGKLQLRRSDDELAMDGTKRELKPSDN